MRPSQQQSPQIAVTKPGRADSQDMSIPPSRLNRAKTTKGPPWMLPLKAWRFGASEKGGTLRVETRKITIRHGKEGSWKPMERDLSSAFSELVRLIPCIALHFNIKITYRNLRILRTLPFLSLNFGTSQKIIQVNFLLTSIFALVTDLYNQDRNATQIYSCFSIRKTTSGLRTFMDVLWPL